jgi:thiamine-monophosphate kinase
MARGKVTEAEVLELVREHWGQPSRKDILVAVGDDCAVLRPTPGRQLVTTTDLLVEGTHFDLRWMSSMQAVGWKALAVSVSDVESMAGTSRWAVGVLGVPPYAKLNEVRALIAGAVQCAAKCGVAIVGGDTVAAPQWIVGFTVNGEIEGQPLLRSSAKPGQDIYLYPPAAGLSQAGLHLLCGRASGETLPLDPSSTNACIEAHLRPEPIPGSGARLRGVGARACIDTSDSLAQTLLHLSRASRVGLRLDFRDITFPPEVLAFVEACRQRKHLRRAGSFEIPARCNPNGKGQRYASRTLFLLSSSEDYGLLFTAPRTVRSRFDFALRIGETVSAREGCTYVDERGETHELTPLGWKHGG